MDNEQKKYLRERLGNAKSDHRNQLWAKQKEPAGIKTARALITRYERQLDKKTSKRRDAIEREAERVREAIVFGDAQKALRLLVAFERRSFV